MHEITNPSDLYDEIVKVAKPEEMDHWYSDLYVKAIPAVTAILERYEYAHQVWSFRDQIERKLWYDIPFAYKPYWEAQTHAEV